MVDPTTSRIKKLPGTMASLGSIAAANDVPWWAGAAVAASIVGSTDCMAVHRAHVEWLQGWLHQWASIHPDLPKPQFLSRWITAPADDFPHV